MNELDKTIDDCLKKAKEYDELAISSRETQDNYVRILGTQYKPDYGTSKECTVSASKNRQLAEWLKELKKYKEKNTPKLVIYSGDGYADGKMVYDWADCPSCNFAIEEDDVDWEMPYCPSCGQRLRWEE